MKTPIIFLFFCFLISCEKDDNSKLFSSKVAGIYYCDRLDDIISADSMYYYIYDSTSIAIDSIKLPKVETKKSLDTIKVISIGDSSIEVDEIPFFLESNYHFYNNFNSQGFSFSGHFSNDSIYFSYWCICRAGFMIKGKKK
jgi:hypothetical protein